MKLFLLAMITYLAAASHVDEQRISSDLNDVEFWLYTRDSEPAMISPNRLGAFDVNRATTIFLMHGFQDDKDFPDKIAPELLKRGDYNVVGVVWVKLAVAPNFNKAGFNSVVVGYLAGNFIADIMQLHGLRADRVHMVGHSYGAHGMGNAGKSVIARTGEKVARLTALDPAQPYYDWHLNDEELRLTTEDAVFVDVLHTNSGRIWDVSRLRVLALSKRLTNLSNVGLLVLRRSSRSRRFLPRRRSAPTGMHRVLPLRLQR